MLMRLREPRLKKRIFANLKNTSGIIENISSSGGFLKTDVQVPEGDLFEIELEITKSKKIMLICKSQRCTNSGIGFKVLDAGNSKQKSFQQYVEKQFEALKRYGHSRVFRTEILVTLKDTNVFGNVYFSNFIEYQGVIREKFLLASVPDLHELIAKTNIRLVTVDTYNKFIQNAYFGDILVAELTTSSIKAASCKLNIIFKNKATDQIIGKGFQTFCVVNSNGKVIRIPGELLEPLDFYQEVTET